MKYKDEVLAALRSGDWEQAHHRLGFPDSNRRCCLGVMCEVAIQNGLELEISSEEFSGGPSISYDDELAILPRRVVSFLDLDDPSPTVLIDGEVVLLAELNDSEECDFHQIADLIEEQL